MKPDIQFSIPLTFNAPRPVEDPTVRAFTGTAYQGGIMTGSMGPCVVDTSTLSWSGLVSLLFNHETDQPVGVIDSITRGVGIAIRGRLFTAEGRGREIREKGDQGFPWQLSMGVYLASIRSVRDGEILAVNGRSLSGPFSLLTHGQLREVSVVTLGADDGTSLQFGGHRPTPQSIRLRNGRRIII